CPDTLVAPRRTIAVGRGYAPDVLFAATYGWVLSTCHSAEIRIKSFRAVTARATFLCLCKETWRKESTPRLRARCVAPGSRSRRDFPSGHPARAENAVHPCTAPCGSCPPTPPLRRGPGGQDQRQQLFAPRRTIAVGRGYAPDALFAPRRRIRRRSGLRPRHALRPAP